MNAPRHRLEAIAPTAQELDNQRRTRAGAMLLGSALLIGVTIGAANQIVEHEQTVQQHDVSGHPTQP